MLNTLDEMKEWYLQCMRDEAADPDNEEYRSFGFCAGIDALRRKILALDPMWIGDSE